MNHSKEKSSDGQWLCFKCGRRNLFHRKGRCKDVGVKMECPCGYSISIQHYQQMWDLRSKGKRQRKIRDCI